MNKKEFYRFIEKGSLQGASRYFEYWYIYSHLPKDGIVLDLGSGRSMLPRAMQEKGLVVIVTEIDWRSVQFQRLQGVNTIEVAGETLPFLENFFDVVISASSIEHFKYDRIMVGEIHRVLKENGIFILTVPVGSKYINNKYQDTKHPSERIYDEATYTEVFLTDFKEISKREFFRGSSKEPINYISHKAWGNEKSIERVSGFADNVGLCVVLQKK